LPIICNIKRQTLENDTEVVRKLITFLLWKRELK
jgi:hypothetical protein